MVRILHKQGDALIVLKRGSFSGVLQVQFPLFVLVLVEFDSRIYFLVSVSVAIEVSVSSSSEHWLLPMFLLLV